MPQGTLELVKGVVIELRGTKTGVSKGKPWKRYDFTVKQLNGQTAKCNTFGTFDKDLIGETVQFDAEFSEKFSNYSVKGEIEVVSSDEITDDTPEDYDTGQEIKVTPKKRGRKPKVKASVDVDNTERVVVKQRTVESDLEAVRKDAVLVFEHDVEDVYNILHKYSDEITTQGLSVGVQALQAIRATLFIEQNKRERSSY